MDGTTGLETRQIAPALTEAMLTGEHSSPISSHTHTHVGLMIQGPGLCPALVVCTQLGEASAEVMEVINLPIQHLQEALQLYLQMTLSVFTFLNVGL